MQQFLRDRIQFRRDLFNRRGEADLFAEAQSNGVGMNIEAGVCGCGFFLRFARCLRTRPVWQPFPDVPIFVHHAIIQTHDENTAILYVHPVNRAKLVQQGAKAAGDLNGNLAQPVRRGGRRRC